MKICGLVHLPLHLKRQGADIFICINASPYETEKLSKKISIAKIVKKTKVPLLYINQVGGQDELVFDGNSFYMNIDGNILEKCNAWKEEIKVINFPYNKNKKTLNNNDIYESFEFNTWSALTVGLRDYFFKNSLKK